jgi:DHA2 family multidrug resistance protein-like MFS transporter
MAMLLVLGPWLLPEFRSDDPPKLDYLSAGLSLAAVLSFIYGVKHAAEYGADATALASIAAGIIIAGVFVSRQLRLEAPLIDMSLFRSPAFSVSLTVNMLALMFMFGMFVFFAQYLQLVEGLSALEAGLWSLPGAIAFTIMSFFNAKLIARFSSLRLFVGGLLMCAIGYVGLFLASGLLATVTMMIIASVGFTPVMALTTAYIVGAVPPEKAGVASALSETAAELGGALGIALLGSFATFIYRNSMVDAVPPSVTESAAVRTSLAAAVDASKSMPSDIAGPILEVARAAFMTSYHSTALLGAIVLALLALLSARKLRTVTAAAH